MSRVVTEYEIEDWFRRKGFTEEGAKKAARSAMESFEFAGMALRLPRRRWRLLTDAGDD